MFFALKVKAINSEDTIKVQTEIFEKLPELARKSVTLDNGRENHLHMRLNKTLNMKTYFVIHTLHMNEEQMKIPMDS
jgi:IS30 family transposase